MQKLNRRSVLKATAAGLAVAYPLSELLVGLVGVDADGRGVPPGVGDGVAADRRCRGVQRVVPRQWNAGQRDQAEKAGQHQAGPAMQAQQRRAHVHQR